MPAYSVTNIAPMMSEATQFPTHSIDNNNLRKIRSKLLHDKFAGAAINGVQSVALAMRIVEIWMLESLRLCSLEKRETFFFTKKS